MRATSDENASVFGIADVTNSNSTCRQVENLRNFTAPSSVDRFHSAAVSLDHCRWPLQWGRRAPAASYSPPIPKHGHYVSTMSVASPRQPAMTGLSPPFPRRSSRQQLDNSLPTDEVIGSSNSNSSVLKYSDLKSRLFDKDGVSQVSLLHVNDVTKSRAFDAFTSLVDMNWAYNITLFLMTYALTWLVFAFLWWLLAVSHGDTIHSIDDVNWTSCVNHVTNFKSALLFSVETQHTIGYGYRYIETECPVAYVVLMLQCALGSLVQSLSFGVLFSKFSRPIRRVQSLIFSQRAVICLRDNSLTRNKFSNVDSPALNPRPIGLHALATHISTPPYGTITNRSSSLAPCRRLCDGIVRATPSEDDANITFECNEVTVISRYQLVFRVADTMTSSPIISANIRMYFIDDRLASKGDVVKLFQCPMRLSTSTGCSDDQFLLLAAWPVDVTHTIDADSQLWNVSGTQLENEQFEIIVILEGIVGSTGMTLQARTSYLPSEIMWAHRFFQLVAERRNKNGRIIIDYRHLNDTIPIEMPRCSAKEYSERYSSLSNDVIMPDVARRVNNSPLQVRHHKDLGPRTSKSTMSSSIITKL